VYMYTVWTGRTHGPLKFSVCVKLFFLQVAVRVSQDDDALHERLLMTPKRKY
jgi:hypothetical protein